MTDYAGTYCATDFREYPEKYRIECADESVLITELYKSEILLLKN